MVYLPLPARRERDLRETIPLLPKFGTFRQIRFMKKNTSVSLGPHFEHFIEERIASGRFHNASEVIRAGLRLLENEEQKIVALRQAVQEGLDSGIASDFDPAEHLAVLKASRKNRE
jgi:antitoxin ParD1/3/4